MPSVQKYRRASDRRDRYRGKYRDASGRERSKSFDTKAEARRWSGEQEAQVARGMRVDTRAARMPWSEWCARWQPSRVVEAETRRTDDRTIRTHVMPRWGTTRLIDVTRLDVQSWVNELSKRRSASTTRHAYYLLSGSLKVAVVEGVLAANPCTGVQLPTPPTGVERFLSDVEAGQILYHLSGRWRVFGELLIGTGLRVSEAAGLHAARVDLADQRIDVVEVYDQVDREMRPYPKSKARRSVPLSDELAALLQEWLDANPAAESCGCEHRAGGCPSGLLITGRDGAAVNPHNFTNRQWRQACQLAGFFTERKNRAGRVTRQPTVRVHDLRHTYASRLAQQGISMERLQLLLGHASLKTTMRYAHLRPRDDWDEVRAALSSSVTAARASGGKLRAV